MKELKMPAIGEYERHVGKLLAVETIPPPPPEKEYIFEEISAKCQLLFKGYLIKTLFENNDFYGLETSIKSAIEEAKTYMQQFGITKDSELEIVVIKVVEQCRKRPTNTENFYADGYRDFRAPEWGCKRDLPEPIETIVWSSKKDIENEGVN